MRSSASIGCRALTSCCVIAAKRARSTDSMSASGAENPEQPQPLNARLPRISVLRTFAIMQLPCRWYASADHSALPLGLQATAAIIRAARTHEICSERVRPAWRRTAEGASPARKRSGNSNGRSCARRASGVPRRALESGGPATRLPSTEGVRRLRRLISQVTGQRGGRRERIARCRPRLLAGPC